VVGRDGGTRAVQLNAVNRTRELTAPNALLSGLGFSFWSPPVPSIITNVEPGGPAAKAGMVVGDKIVRFDGIDVADFASLAKLIESRAHHEVVIDLVRRNDALSLQAVVGDRLRNGQIIGRLGIGSQSSAELPESMRSLQRESPLDAVSIAIATTWDKTALMFKFLWHLVVGDVSLKSISGPVGIAGVTGQAVQIGLLASIETLALISISIGVLNLLPVPILDGGQIVYQLAELLKGGPVSERAQLLGQQVGIVLLGLLMILALFNDIAPHIS
jgi:regulator of sigma E protease